MRRPPKTPWIGAALAVLALVLAVPPAHALKVVTWNVWNYPFGSLSVRQPSFRVVMQAMSPDLMVAQELNSAAGKDSFLLNVLDVVEPGQWSGTWMNVQTGEGMAIFWKPAKLSISNVTAIGNSGPRDVLAFLARPAGYGATTSFRVYSFHLKAGSTASDSTTRRLECTDIRNTLNTAPAETNFMIGGDSNFYGAWEGGYIRLTESQLDNDGRCKDPLFMPGTWHLNSGYAVHDTQCPCNSGCVPGFSGGGMDDRFDLWLSSYSMQDGEGLDFRPGYYSAYGNDGLHFNDDINAGGFNYAVGYTVATHLRNASDHLPVVVEVQVPAKVLAASALDLGTVIAGATATATLNVANGAAVPADELTYSLAAPSGFTAPAGTFAADAGVAGNSHAIGMDTATPGPRSGTLVVSCDDPDSASKSVLLSGLVLSHAEPSLDSLNVLVNGTLDFGPHLAGTFPDRDLRLHNWHGAANRARLVVSSGTITGGGGRFSIVGGFTPDTLGGIGRTWTVRFDDAGATLDSTYEATLSFETADEPLPGATSRPTVGVTLLAYPASTLVGTPVAGLPRELRFHPAHPNPLASGATFGFDLPRAATVSLEIFDLSGRRVARLAEGEWGAGRHEVRWNATGDDAARVPAGLYFARFATPGLASVGRVIVLP